MKILSIDTSCDETAAAVTDGTKVLSNVIWSQASLHARFGGIYPSLAKRQHEERIDWVIEKAMANAKRQMKNVDAIAVTVGPALAIALEVGIKKARELSKEYNKPLIPINHVEGHLLSVLAKPKSQVLSKIEFPVIGFVASGGTTQLVLINKIGNYEILAQTVDDTLGEALDKAARMLGLGYPGGAVLEKLAKEGNPNTYSLPIPLLGQEERMVFSYSGLKTAMYRLVEQEKPLSRKKIQNLASTFQDKAFQHVERIVRKALENYQVKNFFFGGGVSANIELRKRLRKICKKRDIKVWLPYSKKLCTDNAAMIGVAASFKYLKNEYLNPNEADVVERIPRARVDERFIWEN